jgi:translation initiation factor IF-2
MTEEKDSNDKLTLSKPGRLELKKTVETGRVRQSFSHGRTKTVMVEKRKKRTFERGAGGSMQMVQEAHAELKSDAEALARGATADTLTEQERAARVRALHDAAEDEERRRLDELEVERRLLSEAEANRKREEAEANRRTEEEARRQAEDETRRKTEEEARRRTEGEAPARPAPARPAPAAAEEEAGPARRAGVRKTRADAKKLGLGRGKDAPRRRDSGRLTISQALTEAEEGPEERARSLASVRRARERERLRQQAEERRTGTQHIVREVVIPDTITVADLANRMATRASEVVKTLMENDVMATANQTIDAETAELVATEFGHRIKRVSESDVEIGIGATVEDDEAALQPRPPIVTVMGHVDHGKTSLLDALRATDVAAGEAGGITQHIGAYQVSLSDGQRITFLDTPGHEAFTAMRARGAGVTDIVILVVAADDGVQPQTVEAIHHAKAAGVPIIIAINKIDREGAEPDRVRNELLSHELVVEKLGGDILDVEVSALKKTNLDKLEEAILLQSEILELKANPDRPAQGVVVEAKMERGRGSVATVLVQHGTLRRGDVFVAGAEWGRVRAVVDDHGKNIEEAGPSLPVEVLGLQGVPGAGDEFHVVKDDGQAREIAEYRTRQQQRVTAASQERGTLEQMFDQIQAGEAAELAIVIKGDVQGSVEAIIGSLEKLQTDEAKVRILHSAVGGITESDIILANASEGVIIGFNVRANPQARDMARRDNVDIRYYSIIYNVIDDMRKLMSGLLAPEVRESQLGYAEIRQVFSVSKSGKVAGCMVTEGEVKRGAKVRLLRDDVVIHEGSLKTLKRFKDDARSVQQGYECGMAFENYDDIKEGDVIECFEVEEIARSL